MPEITRNRTLRPSTRKETSSYKVNTEKVGVNDTLVVSIDHESKPFQKVYKFKGSDIANKKSVHFTMIESDNKISIKWIGAQPI
jgi:hypothetical protein